MIKISFTDDIVEAARQQCPICGSTNKRPLLTMQDVSLVPGGLHMSTCEDCGTGYFTDENPVVGYDFDGFNQDYWFNYVQNGAGISAMLEPLLAVGRPRKGSLLDIGCGFGFVPNFWETSEFGKAVGLEMSHYGKVGSEKLGINIIPKYYSEAVELHAEKFDYVFSSEVIEHVESPESFVKEIASALADDGILVLTTPSASALTKDAPYLLLLPVLSPGFHFFIASKQGLEDLLRRCGLEHVVVNDSGHRLFAWASRKPLPEITDGFADWPVYLKYLDKLSHNSDHHVAGGALYRAMKDAFNLGFFDQADDLYSRFLPLARDRYGVDFDDIAASTAKRRARTDLDNATFPSWLGTGTLYAGLINKRHGASLEKQRVLFSEAVEIMQAEIEMGAQFAGEPFHFISYAKRELMEVLQKQRAETPAAAADPKQSFVLRRPKQIAGRDVCLFSIYAPGGKVSPATVTYVESLAEDGFTVIACVALDDPTADFDVASLSAAAGIVVHKNGGMDFAAWAGALRLLPDCWSASRLVFTNDSVFMLPDLMTPFVDRLRKETADFVGLTDSLCITPHVQTYFFQFQGAALSNPKLHAFWASVQVFTDKKDVIHTYEVKLLQHVTDDWGLISNIMFSLDKILPHATTADCAQLNVSHSYWDHLVSQGFPFVKVELLRDNPLQLNILHWRSVLQAHGASVDLVEKHVEIRKGHANSASLLLQDRSEWRMILKDINRVRLNARRRRQARKIIDAG
jgi:SAM-dependent methyltransferase